jgi:hypothetical protein
VDKPTFCERVEVAAYRHLGDAEGLAQLADARELALADQIQELLAANAGWDGGCVRDDREVTRAP